MSLARAAGMKRAPRKQTLEFGPWTGGMRTDVSAESARRNEAELLMNFTMTGEGNAVTRPGFYFTGIQLPAEAGAVEAVRVAGEWLLVMADLSGNLFYRGMDDHDAAPTQFGSVPTGYVPVLMNFGDALIIVDGTHVKRWRGPGYAVELCFDDGAGHNTGFFATRDESPDGTYALGASYHAAAAQRFGTGQIPAGWIIDMTRFMVDLRRQGDTPLDGTVALTIRKQLGAIPDRTTDTLLLSETLAEAAELTGDWQEFYILPAPGAVSFSSDGTYYAAMEWVPDSVAGDDDNYIEIPTTTNDTWSGTFDAGGVFTGEERAICCVVGPGLPPVAAFGVVHQNRLFLAGDADHPTRIWYSAAANPLDWSTPDGGGWLSADREVGALASYYGTVWAFGTWRQPSLSRLSGNSPSQWVMSPSIQKVSAYHRSVMVTPTDVLFLHQSGFDSLSNIQEYGDVRAMTQSARIKELFAGRENIEGVIAGYEPDRGTVCVSIPGNPDVFVIHPWIKTAESRGASAVGVMPVTIWRLRLTRGGDEWVTCYGSNGTGMWFGTNTGHIYCVSEREMTDDGQMPEYDLRSNVPTTRFGEMAASAVSVDAFSFGEPAFTLEFWTRHIRPEDGEEPVLRVPVTIPAELHNELYLDRYPVNFNFRRLQIRVTDIEPGSEPLQIGPMFLQARPIGGR